MRRKIVLRHHLFHEGIRKRVSEATRKEYVEGTMIGAVRRIQVKQREINPKLYPGKAEKSLQKRLLLNSLARQSLLCTEQEESV